MEDQLFPAKYKTSKWQTWRMGGAAVFQYMKRSVAGLVRPLIGGLSNQALAASPVFVGIYLPWA